MTCCVCHILLSIEDVVFEKTENIKKLLPFCPQHAQTNKSNICPICIKPVTVNQEISQINSVLYHTPCLICYNCEQPFNCILFLIYYQ